MAVNALSTQTFILIRTYEGSQAEVIGQTIQDIAKQYGLSETELFCSSQRNEGMLKGLPFARIENGLDKTSTEPTVSESNQQLFERMKACIERHLNDCAGKKSTLAVFISHEKPIRAFLKRLHSHGALSGDAEIFSQGKIHQGECLILQRDKEKFVALRRIVPRPC
jgi:hypothetical protein